MMGFAIINTAASVIIFNIFKGFFLACSVFFSGLVNYFHG